MKTTITKLKNKDMDMLNDISTSTTKTAITAYFTKFKYNKNWCDGKVGDYHFQAKLFDEGSEFGINNGRVSTLAIWDEKIRQAEKDFFSACKVYYDRKWNIKPKKDFKLYFNAVMELLENAPKQCEDMVFKHCKNHSGFVAECSMCCDIHNSYINFIYAVEYGFRQCEKGLNLEKTLIEAEKFFKESK